MSALTQEELKKLFNYDSNTGIFTRLVYRSPNAQIGQIAGSITCDGYLAIRINGQSYQCHQLAWFYVHGIFVSMLDHKNSIRTDNSINNLRETTKSLNAANCQAHWDNPTGIKGVFQRGKKFCAVVRKDGKSYWLGGFPTIEKAKEAHRQKTKELYGDHASW